MGATGGDSAAGLDDGDKLVSTGDVLVSKIDDELVLLDRGSGLYYGLNTVGAFLWDQLEEPTRVGDLVDATSAEFDIPTEECHKDIHEFLNEMLEAELARQA